MLLMGSRCTGLGCSALAGAPAAVQSQSFRNVLLVIESCKRTARQPLRTSGNMQHQKQQEQHFLLRMICKYAQVAINLPQVRGGATGNGGALEQAVA